METGAWSGRRSDISYTQSDPRPVHAPLDICAATGLHPQVTAEHGGLLVDDLDALTELAHGFNDLVRQRRGHQLEQWITQATQS
jgi:hypothetical protein